MRKLGGIPDIYVGCAGWSIPDLGRTLFPAEGSGLERYAARFRAVEINSSFTRRHKPSTYSRWAASVPESFRFAVKLPRQIKHVSRMSNLASLDDFLAESGALGDRLGPLLAQLPPSLAFEARTAGPFLAALRDRFGGLVGCEPRHSSWFTREADVLLPQWDRRQRELT